jgi:hypothetical protein
MYNDRLHEVAPRRPGRVSERRRDHLTETIRRLDWHALADRSAPLPADVPLERLLEFFKGCLQVQMFDRGEFDQWR